MNIQDSDHNLLALWAEIMQVLIVALLVISVFSIVIYWIRYNSKKSMKAKFDLASTSEIKVLRFSQFMIAVAIFLFGQHSTRRNCH